MHAFRDSNSIHFRNGLIWQWCMQGRSWEQHHNTLSAWKGFSTLTQLIAILDDWFSSLDKRIRTDVLLLDFAKAFDSVPHQRLLHKLHYYGIQNILASSNAYIWAFFFPMGYSSLEQPGYSDAVCAESVMSF